MDIRYYCYSDKRIPPQQLRLLYQDANWWPERQEEDIYAMLESGASFGAWNNGELIGFIRSVSDGKFRAYIEDVVVHHDFQRCGIGRQLVRHMLERLGSIDVISLFCEDDLIEFYQKQGFKKSRSQFVLHRKA